MPDYEHIADLCSSIQVSEVKSALKNLLLSSSPGKNLTVVALLSFYRKILEVSHSPDTGDNEVRTRLLETGSLLFGPLYAPEKERSKAQRLKILQDLGFCIDPLRFLNKTQIELFFCYVKETGLISPNL